MARAESCHVALTAALALVGTAALAQAPPTSLAQAIRAAEQETAGRARKAELEQDRGTDVYEIKTVAKDKSATVLVELVSGKVIRVEGTGFLSGVFEREDRREDQAELARLEALSMTLADATGAAERETGGRAVEASLRSQYGQTLFQVRVVKDLVPQRVMVDPASGRVVTLAQPGHRDDH
jgi:uncharacterized membrane protein YkoI